MTLQLQVKLLVNYSPRDLSRLNLNAFVRLAPPPLRLAQRTFEVETLSEHEAPDSMILLHQRRFDDVHRGQAP
jgi:hypothetical protein